MKAWTGKESTEDEKQHQVGETVDQFCQIIIAKQQQPWIVCDYLSLLALVALPRPPKPGKDMKVKRHSCIYCAILDQLKKGVTPDQESQHYDLCTKTIGRFVAEYDWDEFLIYEHRDW